MDTTRTFRALVVAAIVFQASACGNDTAGPSGIDCSAPVTTTCPAGADSSFPSFEQITLYKGGRPECRADTSELIPVEFSILNSREGFAIGQVVTGIRLILPASTPNLPLATPQRRNAQFEASGTAQQPQFSLPLRLVIIEWSTGITRSRCDVFVHGVTRFP